MSDSITEALTLYESKSNEPLPQSNKTTGQAQPSSTSVDLLSDFADLFVNSTSQQNSQQQQQTVPLSSSCFDSLTPATEPTSSSMPIPPRTESPFVPVMSKPHQEINFPESQSQDVQMLNPFSTLSPEKPQAKELVNNIQQPPKNVVDFDLFLSPTSSTNNDTSMTMPTLHPLTSAATTITQAPMPSIQSATAFLTPETQTPFTDPHSSDIQVFHSKQFPTSFSLHQSNHLLKLEILIQRAHIFSASCN